MPRSRSEEARRKVLTAAQEVLSDASVEGFTVEEVAKRSGVAKTTIYRHWPKGNTLMLEAMDCMVHTFPTPNTGSLRSDLEAFMGLVLPVVGDPAVTRSMLHVVAAAAADPEIGAIHRQMMAERLGPIRTILDLAVGRGELPADLDIDVTLDLIEGPFFVRTMVRREPIDDDTVRRLVASMVGGLTTAPPRRAPSGVGGAAPRPVPGDPQVSAT